MTEESRPRVDGVCKGIVASDPKQGVCAADVQAAIDAAGAQYRKLYGVAPIHVALPVGLTPQSLKLYTLNLGVETGPCMVIVGRIAVDGAGAANSRQPGSPGGSNHYPKGRLRTGRLCRGV